MYVLRMFIGILIGQYYEFGVVIVLVVVWWVGWCVMYLGFDLLVFDFVYVCEVSLVVVFVLSIIYLLDDFDLLVDLLLLCEFFGLIFLIFVGGCVVLYYVQQFFEGMLILVMDLDELQRVFDELCIVVLVDV